MKITKEAVEEFKGEMFAIDIAKLSNFISAAIVTTGDLQ